MATLTAVQLAREVRKEVRALSGGWLNPGRVTQDRSIMFSDEADAELISDEGHGYLEQAVANVAERVPELTGRWDYVQTGVLAFYDN